MERLIIIPEDSVESAEKRLKLRKITNKINGKNIQKLISEDILLLIKELNQTNLTEIIVWGKSDLGFEAAWIASNENNDLEYKATCDSDKGLVSDVFSSDNTRILSEPELCLEEWSNLGNLIMNHQINSMIGKPILVFNVTVGVLTLVEYKNNPSINNSLQNLFSALNNLIGSSIELYVVKNMLGLQ